MQSLPVQACSERMMMTMTREQATLTPGSASQI